ncbi:FKBP-type peptidyl-prolyl cis-trans isomerase [Methanovulcanius yangii]|uniref:FKBP-type peptidyl-prolyl cis-trans isomerase n=1 Tax=Methanovulcanius yangii TaxID=1789227 RepID=UPI0029CA7C70|nr:peptidylprolyl isomerase [Methanovulcanius yangii]
MNTRIARIPPWLLLGIVIALGIVCAGCTTQDAPAAETAENGDLVQVHYRGYLDSGEEFDNSYAKGQPIEFVVGAGQMIAGFDAAVVGMAVGDTKTIHLTPEEAYGYPDPDLILPFPRESFGNGSSPQTGDEYTLTSGGSTYRVVVVSVNETTVMVDFNPRLAGQDLNFDMELVGLEKNAEDGS